MTWKTIGPKAILSLTEGNLQLYFLGLVTIAFEEVESMLEDLSRVSERCKIEVRTY